MAYYFSQEDIEDLRKEVPAQSVLKYTDAKVKRKSILCPNPEHCDTHYGNCMLLRDGRIHCFACGKEFSAIDILVFNGYTFYEAACILADESGHPEDFEKSSRRQGRTDSERKLSVEEKRFLGLAPHIQTDRVINCSDTRPEGRPCRKEYSFVEEDGVLESRTEYLIVENTPKPWRDLIREEPQIYAWMVRNKCKEVMVQCIMAAEMDSGIMQEAKKTYQRAEEIYIRFGGVLKSKKELCSNVSKTFHIFR